MTTPSTKLYLLTSGRYSDYCVDGLVEGPDGITDEQWSLAYQAADKAWWEGLDKDEDVKKETVWQAELAKLGCKPVDFEELHYGT